MSKSLYSQPRMPSARGIVPSGKANLRRNTLCIARKFNAAWRKKTGQTAFEVVNTGSKKIRFQSQRQEEFSKLLLSLCQSKSVWEVWADFITLSACTISNLAGKDAPSYAEREAEYMKIIQRYDTAEVDVFPQLLAILTMALEENPEQDFLGTLFTALNLHDYLKGQFFSPYSICMATAATTLKGIKEQAKEIGWVSVCDPCCGAGALLIAAHNYAQFEHIGPENILFVGQDINRTAGLMCYIQLFLLGCAGYVVIGDSILHPLDGPTNSPLLINLQPGQELWLMPALFSETWATRIAVERLKLALDSPISEDNADNQQTPEN